MIFLQRCGFATGLEKNRSPLKRVYFNIYGKIAIHMPKINTSKN